MSTLKKISYTLLYSAIALLNMPLQAKADLFNVQFGGFYQYTGGGVVGSATDHWNQATSTSSSLGLLKSDGVISNGVVVYYSDVITNIGSDENGFLDKPAENLMSGFISTTSSQTIKFEKLSKETEYTLYVYTQSEKDNQSLKIYGDQLTATGGGHSSTTNLSIAGSDSFVLGQNYLVMKAKTDIYGDLLINYSSAASRGVINGIQLSSAVPEPSTIVLMGIGGLLLVVSFRKSSLSTVFSSVAA